MCDPSGNVVPPRAPRYSRDVKLYGFDGIDYRLSLMPLAARRALDVGGLHLSLEGFLSLAHAERVLLTAAGSEAVIDVARVHEIVRPAVPPAHAQAPLEEPPAESVPAEVSALLDSERPLTAAVWSALSPLDRYVLWKVCLRARENPSKISRVEQAYREIVGRSALSSHLRPEGGVRMVDVGHKPSTRRRAIAETHIELGQEAFQRLDRADSPKGDVLGTARLAGIMAAKKTSDLIPLCHPLPLSHVDIAVEKDTEGSSLRLLCSVETVAPTGVEMEALVGASVAALTIYDMLKSIDKGMIIGPTRLLEKSGGRSDFRAAPQELSAPSSEDPR